MYMILGLALFVTACVAAPAGPVGTVPVGSRPTGEHHEQVPIVSQESVQEPGGKFHFSFEGGDGSKVSQEGELKQVGKNAEDAGEVSHGNYEYVGDDGHHYHVEYTADENGFHPHGDHIPQVPEAIARALKWAEEHPYHPPEEQKHVGVVH